MTTCCIINALGLALSPAMIFLRVHVKQRMTAEAPAPGYSNWLDDVWSVFGSNAAFNYSNASKTNSQLYS